MQKKILIVGAGMAGCFMGICLAKSGFDVEIYEERPDVRRNPYNSGRSFNLTLYTRSIIAMQKMGIWDDVKKYAVKALGNVAHYSDSRVVFDKFDATDKEVLYTIHRNQLNSTLLNIVDKHANVQIFFESRLTSIDKDRKELTLLKYGKKTIVKADVVIGADGVNSEVRNQMQKFSECELTREYEDWGYKEVHVSEENARALNLRTLATHTWPRPNSLLIAFPNPDESFTLMFNLPLVGHDGFSELNNEKKIKNYIKTQFPDLLHIESEIVESILTKPTGNFVTIKTNPWYYKDFIVLIGDSAHGVIPFYGQGVSAAFDDCLTLTDLLSHDNHDLEKIFSNYQQSRKVNTDILAQLSKENFVELRDKSRSSYYVLKDKTDTFLHKLFPFFWLPPLYVHVAHGTMPYAVAVEKRKNLDKISKIIGVDLVVRLVSLPVSVVKKLMGL